MSAVTAALASLIKAGTAATGTETSCLIEPPAWRCTSPNISRMRQNALACSRLSAMVASMTRPLFRALRQESSMHVAQALALLRRQLDQHVPVMRRGQRIAAAGAVLEHEFDAAPRS